DPRRRKAKLIDRFSHWHPPITDVLEATPESAILRNDVYFLKPLARWTRERIVLVGDAAHATTPGIGQGAAQALEDAIVLARELVASARHAANAEHPEPIRPGRQHSVGPGVDPHEVVAIQRQPLAIDLHRTRAVQGHVELLLP